MPMCALSSACSFYRRFHQSDDLACNALVNLYCRGPLAFRCKIRETEPSQPMGTSGTMLPNGCVVGGEAGRPDRSV